MRASDGHPSIAVSASEGFEPVRVSRTGPSRKNTRRMSTGSCRWGGESLVMPVCLVSASLGGCGQVCQCKQARVFAPVVPVRNGPLLTPGKFRCDRFRLCSGRPTCGRALARRPMPLSRSCGAPAATARVLQEPRLTFDSTRPVGRSTQDRHRRGLHHPTPVQAAAIPLVLAGRDVLAAAQTGTPARPQRSHCRSSIASVRRRTRRSRPPATGSARSSSCPPASSRCRSTRVSGPTAGPSRCVRPSCTAASRWTRRSRPCARASRSSSRPRVACSTSSARRSRTWARSRFCPRRGRPDARHGLPAGHPAHHRALPKRRQNLMFGDLLRRHPAPVRDDPAGPRDGRGRPAQHHRRGHPPARLSGGSRPQGGAPRASHPVR